LLKQRHQVFVAMFGVADALAATSACYGAWALRVIRRGDPWPVEWEQFVKEPLVLFVVPIALYVFSVFGLYRPMRDRSIWNEQSRVLRASLLAVGAVVLALWVLGSDFLTNSGSSAKPLGPLSWADTPAKVQLGWLALLLPLFVGLQRWMLRLMLRYIRSRGWNLRHVAIIGTGRLGQITCRTLARNSWTGIQVSYFISHHPKTSRRICLNRPVLGGLEELEVILERRPLDAIYLAIPSRHAAQVPDILKRLERFAVDVRIIPDVSPRYLPQSMTVGELEGMPILSYRECPLYGLGGFTKRLLDCSGAAAALVLFAPVMIVAAILVRLSGPGPIVFKQRRVSLGGEQFDIYKFRTMADAVQEASVVESGGTSEWTQRDDPRITPVGKWLRKTSLDELPQLFNVLRGDMSLVGPRPERPELIARFRDDWRGYMLRQHVKAGMTGWAQVNGLRGQSSLRKRLQYDLFYIRHWSVLFDIRILFMTIFRGFVDPNAY